jgi:membrane-associated phospholipid phosphatase
MALACRRGEKARPLAAMTLGATVGPTRKVRRGSLLTLVAASLLAGTLFARSARADEPPGPYRLDLAVDLSITGVAGATWALTESSAKSAIPPSCPCQASSLNALDRGVAGRWHPSISTISDAALISTLVLSFGVDFLDVIVSRERVLGWLSDALVIAQSVAVSGALNGVTKVTVQRPRPLLYGAAANDRALSLPDNYTSFYSGHTSTAFAAGMSYAQTFALRHPDSPYRFVVFAAAGTVGAAVGTLRVLAGKHFPTDVLVGAGAGTAVGLLVPWLHARTGASGMTALPVRGGAVLALSGSW